MSLAYNQLFLLDAAHRVIYLDCNATSPLLAGVLEAMLPFLSGRFGNPSSKHPIGSEARTAVERARHIVASFLRALPSELYFTSGGTESVGIAFQCALAGGERAAIISAVEHACVLDTGKAWSSRGNRLEVAPVDPHGIIDLTELDRLLRSCGPAFVSVIWVNNETGVVSPMREIAQLCCRHNALLHVDGVQAPTRIEIDASQIPFDYLSLSAHKFHGPKGVGALFVRSTAPKSPLTPGHQEHGLRGGTENTAGIIGAAEALRLQSHWPNEAQRQSNLRDTFETEAKRRIPGTEVNGSGAPRVANTSNLHVPNRSAADMVYALGQAGLCASAGAACSTGGHPSHVLLAMGYDEDRANSSLRFSMGNETTEQEIAQALTILARVHECTLPNWGNV
jgi:cysteine desulfurase